MAGNRYPFSVTHLCLSLCEKVSKGLSLSVFACLSVCVGRGKDSRRLGGTGLLARLPVGVVVGSY